MTNQTILITSATGRIGKELVARLATVDGITTRACYFSEDKADMLTSLGADEVVKFDLSDPATWGPALDGVTAVYSASLDPMLEGHLAFCKELGKHRDTVKHVVRVSCMGADTNTASYDPDQHASRAGAGIPLMLQHYWWGEKALIDAGLNVTALRNNFFMNHLLKTDCETIDAEGWFSNPLGDMRNSFVATRDIAEATAVCLIEGPERHGNKFYDITGPAPQSMSEIAADLGRAMGKTIEYRAQSMVDFENDFGATRAEFFEYLTNGFYTRCSPDFYNLTGHKPTSYYDYLTTKGASGETGLEELYQGNLWKKGVDAMKDAAKV
ncbi:NAD(P)H-binding protein [Amylibacter sp. IMCC11727]|uniref:NmrA family NAD(P)-binding protein n=1 Tax=Amylibacter sp. IMCC11727 TaxID=3039851 RepID=UPI00244DC663|nr:NAD(P)H-binding protein [Amylibacter sp. IMCC11727]WGI21126.1 NAD(P)H-binding protein [Amylibacter sp. IMCC11727]